ncbi:MAG: GDSL-type esterase/lipase family protein, partial [Planctomycetota bacterium]|nr:GDSL-type esterase/lipase family protein [Planctomycetota bacterium]
MTYATMCAVLLGLLALSVGCAPGPAQPAGLGAVMPVGDSITADYSSDLTVDAGWRAPLYKSLAEAGYSFQFVGVTNVNPGRSLPTAPLDQTWHCGGTAESYRTLAVRDNIGAWLKTLAGKGQTPAFILMMTGTNDINENNAPASVGNVSSIIDTIHSQAPKCKLLLAKIVPVFSADNAWVASYNAGLVTLVTQKRAAG